MSVLAARSTIPLISVILPVYNGEKYLAAAIDSVLAQSFSDFELIIIDDGSTDGTKNILDEYAKDDPRVRYIARANRGLANTLNELIDLSRGAWIARMDADDIALPHRFQRQLDWLDRTGADIAGSWVRRFGTSDKRLVILQSDDAAIRMEMLFSSPFAHPSVMIRTSLMRRLHYDRIWEKAEDYDLWVRAIELGCKMTNVPEVLLLYRVHAEQISSRTLKLQKEVEQGVRRRYWEFVFHSMAIGPDWLDEVMKVFGSSVTGINMYAVDESFSALLRYSHGESRNVVLNHMTRIYLRVAADCPDVVSRWGKLNREFGVGWGAGTKFVLCVFRVLRIRADSDLYKQLKRLYIWKASRQAIRVD